MTGSRPQAADQHRVINNIARFEHGKWLSQGLGYGKSRHEAMLVGWLCRTADLIGFRQFAGDQNSITSDQRDSLLDSTVDQPNGQLVVPSVVLNAIRSFLSITILTQVFVNDAI